MTEILTRSFFVEELDSLKEEFARDTGAEKVVVDLLLKSGGHVRMEGTPVCGATYLYFDRKDGHKVTRTVLGYAAILGVHLAAEKDKSGKLGFHG
ncbi:MAG TPA: hypothetical protein VD902_19765 [Symbiobacteriaceae bacterium]|nr:hypothetical protein [Symbiobacteriaceae bacterium]